jgi:uncharacterized protein (TIGR02246 family)
MGPGIRAAFLPLIAVFSMMLANGIAADPQGNLDTLSQQKVAGAADPEKEIYDQLTRMLDAWNRHDIDAYVNCFWRSDDLVVVIEGENFRGWEFLSKAYHLGYPNPDAMGTIIPDRVQVQMLAPDIGLALTWYTAHFSKKKEFETSTLIMKKLPEGWRIAVMHTSFVEP